MRQNPASVRGIALIIIAVSLCAGCDRTEPEPIAIQPHTDKPVNPNINIEYGDDPRQVLDIYCPTPKKVDTALVVFVHGGAWISGDKSAFAEIGRRFSDNGFCFASVEYRLSPGVQVPEHAKDVAKAYAFLLGQAAKYGYSKQRVYLMGHSAGAHTAGMLATGPYLRDAGVAREDMPRGFIGLEGIYDIPGLVKRWPTYDEWFISKAFGESKRWPEGSPTERSVISKAPWLVIHSAEDELVDVGQSEGFASHLKKSGVKVERFAAKGKHEEVVHDLWKPDNATFRAILPFIGH